MKIKYILICCIVLLGACKKENKPKEWVYKETIKVEGVNPIGIANVEGELWLSDGDHNRLVKIDDRGKIIAEIDSLDRPMHIDNHYDYIYVPQYGNDKVGIFYPEGNKAIFKGYKKDSLDVATNTLDAPSGIGVLGGEIAITDFYNNRILYNNESKWISFGKEGKKEGEFYYPTDVQITDKFIWVADAYNNRIQVFDKKGNFVKLMGQDQKMNAATGIYVSDDEVFITDFENNRALIFNHDGTVKQELKEGINKATDLIIKDDVLHIINYRAGELVLYNLQEKKQ